MRANYRMLWLLWTLFLVSVVIDDPVAFFHKSVWNHFVHDSIDVDCSLPDSLLPMTNKQLFDDQVIGMGLHGLRFDRQLSLVFGLLMISSKAHLVSACPDRRSTDFVCAAQRRCDGLYINRGITRHKWTLQACQIPLCRWITGEDKETSWTLNSATGSTKWLVCCFITTHRQLKNIQIESHDHVAFTKALQYHEHAQRLFQLSTTNRSTHISNSVDVFPARFHWWYHV